jgi:ankyrin repeat protein
LEFASQPAAPPDAIPETTAVVSPGTQSLQAALLAADLDTLVQLLNGGWNVNERDEKGRTALLRATELVRPDLCSFLLIVGADPDIPDNQGQTPLMESLRYISCSSQWMTSLLLLSGADPSASRKDGRTALTFATAAGHQIGIEWLTWAGADVLAETPKGALTSYATHPPVKRRLLKLGVQEQRKDQPDDPVELLIQSAIDGDEKATEALLKSGVDPRATHPKDKRNAAEHAIPHNHFDVVDVLLKYGADINDQQPKDGSSSLHFLAAWGGSQGSSKAAAKLMVKMFERGANPNLAMKNGMTPLMIAAKEGVTGENTATLLAAEADLTLRQKDGLTALGIARKYGRNKMVEYLLARGAKD